MLNKIYSGTVSKLVERIAERLTQPGAAHVVTLNPEIWVMADQVSSVRTAIDTADWVTADGIGISIAQRVMGHQVSPRITGVDLTSALLKVPQIRVYLLGSTQDVIDDASTTIRRQFPSAVVVGGHHGFFSIDEIDVVTGAIQRSRPDIVLVGMGSPRQDQVIQHLKPVLPYGILIGVGGVLDLLAGRVRRAPTWMQICGLEWVWRLALQPQRLRRFLRMLPAFAKKIIRG